jgi:hypothetical protein
MILGGTMLAPNILKMMSIAESMGANALIDKEFAQAMMLVKLAFVLILALLVAAVWLSVFRKKTN